MDKKLESRKMNHELRIMIFIVLSIFLASLFMIQTAYAEVKIGDVFGFGEIKTLGEGTSRLVMPAFSLATALVVIYFLLGAFKYLKSGGNKEEVEGARQMITHGIVGFIILMFAFLVLQFLLSALLGITTLQLF